jgi:hypothetical protein
MGKLVFAHCKHLVQWFECVTKSGYDISVYAKLRVIGIVVLISILCSNLLLTQKIVHCLPTKFQSWLKGGSVLNCRGDRKSRPDNLVEIHCLCK